MTNVVVDFESYYSKKDGISVVQLGNQNYFAAADAYILAITIGTEVKCGTIEELRPMCEQMALDPTLQFWAANSNFDKGWWDKEYTPTQIEDWQCILDVGRGNQLPGNLAGLSKVVLGREMDKTTRDEMNGVHYENLSPAEQEKVQQYCATDVINTEELVRTVPALSRLENDVAKHTRLINRRGVHIDVDLVEEDKTKLEVMRFEAHKAIPWTAAGEKPLSMKQLERYCASEGIPCPESTAKTDEDCTELMSAHPKLNKVLESMRRFRKANTLLEKLGTLQERTTPEGILPLDIIYCGAPHTKRWSSKGFNIQNLDKQPTVINADLQFWSRNWIIAPPGKQLLILDYAQVEPRCLNWLVGNEEMMIALRNGYSYYEAYARFARNWSGAPGTIKAEYGKAKYTLLKNECLGLGYGMGVDRFIGYAAEQGNIITAAEAKPVVDGFRARNPKIVEFWGKLDNLIISACRDKSKELKIQMPTGDYLRYYSLRCSGRGNYVGFKTKGVFSEDAKVRRLWGGTATENVTQRMARDVLAEGILRLEASGFPVLFTSHDEVIMAVDDTQDEGRKKEIYDEAARIMAQAPDWAPDLPLGVSGEFSPCYTKGD